MEKPDSETKHLQRLSIRNIDRIKKLGNIGYTDSLNDALDRILGEYTEMKNKDRVLDEYTQMKNKQKKTN